jgi:predicted Zn-dependent protease
MRILFILTAMFSVNSSLADNCASIYDSLLAEQAKVLADSEKSPTKTQDKLSSLSRKIEASLSGCSSSAQLNSLMAETQVSLGKNKDGLKYARAAYAADAESWEANHALGFVLSLGGQCNAGFPYLEKAADSSPQKYEILLNICSTYESCGKFQEAIFSCTEVLESKEASLLGPAFYIRARAYKAMGMLEAADKDFYQARDAGFEGDQYYTEEHYGR